MPDAELAGVAAPAGPPRVGRWRVAEWVLVLALVVLPIWLPGPSPTLDAPQHTLEGYLVNHLHQPGRGYDRYLRIRLPYTGAGYALLVAAFNLVLPIRAADQSALTAICLAQALGLLRLIRIAQGERSPWRWLAWIFPFAAGYYYGIHNYGLGLGVGLWAVAAGLGIVIDQRAGRPTPPRRFVVLGLWLALTAIAHSFAASIAGLVLGALLLGGAPPGRRRSDLGTLLVVSLPTLFWIALVGMSGFRYQDQPIANELVFDLHNYAVLHETLFETPYETLWLPKLTILLALGITARGAWRRDPRSLGIGLALAALLGMQPFIPDSIQAWAKLPIRFTPWIFALAVAGAGTGDWRRRPRRVLSAAVLAIAISAAAMVLIANLELVGLRREFESGIGKVQPVPMRRLYLYPPLGKNLRRGSHMMWNMHLYYMMDEGGVFTRIYRNRPEAHLLYETGFFKELDSRVVRGYDVDRAPEPMQWREHAFSGLTFDEVLLWEPLPKQLREFLADGYEVRFHNGGLFRLAPPHRRVSLVLGGGAPAGSQAAVLQADLPWPITIAPLQPAAGGGVGVEIGDLPARPLRILITRGRGQDPEPIATYDVDLKSGDMKLER